MRAHVQAYAGGMFAVDPDQADADDNVAFPLPMHKRITLLDWVARSCYPEQGESGASLQQKPKQTASSPAPRLVA